MTGKVYLVGAGPGDPGLLTLKGRWALEQADVVVYDNLAAREILDWAPAGALRLYAGKKRADHSMPQTEISALLIEHALQGRTVVRLKGGDPYLFGRGGEEVEALAAAGVPFVVVPGVTAALGMAAYTGIPLTHREHTSSVTFVTGHEPDRIDWTRIGHSETLVVYMGLTTIGVIAARLMAAGRAAITPAMVVRWATRPGQQTLHATLGTIAAVVEASGMKPPATILIGEVAGVGPQMNWFERLPLFGRTVLVTRAAEQSEDFAAALRERGATVIEAPVLAIEPPLDATPLRAAIAGLASYDWLLFTSANGVSRFRDALLAAGRDARAIRGQICAVGPMTAGALEMAGLRPDLVPERFVAEGVLEAFAALPVAGLRFLLPRAAVARDLLPDALRARGAVVDVVEAYRNVPPPETAALLAEIDSVDWVPFTSSSSVKNFLALGGGRLLAGGAKVVSIGPATSATLLQHGITDFVEAAAHTTAGLLEAMS